MTRWIAKVVVPLAFVAVTGCGSDSHKPSIADKLHRANRAANRSYQNAIAQSRKLERSTETLQQAQARKRKAHTETQKAEAELRRALAK